jgi:pyruvate dehydrogenase E2 component (dihydrolipoamide acetyltransferase)
MRLEFRLPQFGMGMTDGTITRWYRSEGDIVAEGETLFEVEAAKTTVEVPSPVAGRLARIVVPVDQNVPVQTVVALIETDVDEKDAGSTADAPAAAPAGGGGVGARTERKDASPLARRIAALNGVDVTSLAGSGSNGRVRRKDVDAALGRSAGAGRWDAGLQIEPRARRAARELGIDLVAVEGSGPSGRIVEADVREFREPQAVARPAPPVSSAELAYIDTPHSSMRRVIARRLSGSKQTVPHFYLVAHCEVDRLIEARKRINTAFPATRVSINDFVILALARALEMVPDANVCWTATALRHFADVDVAVAVATDSGLITPIIRKANAKSVRRIAAEAKALTERARAGQLGRDEYEGGTVSVSNLGMYGTEEFSAIINPPQACILAVGAGTERPVVRDGALAVASVMTCTLSVDHRAIDGAVAAQLLAAFKAMIEDPVALLS